MKALLISFSGRQSPGNCESLLNFLLELLKGRGVDASLINIRDLEVNPCSGCNYECFDPSGHCPIQDDVGIVYEQMLLSDLVIMAIPTYSAAPPSRYFIWRERSQGFFINSDLYDRYLDVVKGFIVFGNEEAGGREVVGILKGESESPSEFLLIQSHQYGKCSIEGRLVDFPEVQQKLVSFVDGLLSKYDH